MIIAARILFVRDVIQKPRSLEGSNPSYRQTIRFPTQARRFRPCGSHPLRPVGISPFELGARRRPQWRRVRCFRWLPWPRRWECFVWLPCQRRISGQIVRSGVQTFAVKTAPKSGLHATTAGIRRIADPTGHLTASPSTACTCLAYIARSDDSPDLVPPFRP